MSPIEQWTLTDGTPLTLRPVRAQDAPALNSLIQGLCARDRRWRFHGAVTGVTPDRLRSMTRVDPGRGVALVVVAHLPDGDALIADARWVVDDSGQGAEFALMVAAAWRCLGVGERAVAALQRAAAHGGLRWLHGSVLADNTPMLALMRRCSFHCTPKRGDDRLVAVEACVDRAGRIASPIRPSVPSHRSNGVALRCLRSPTGLALPL